MHTLSRRWRRADADDRGFTLVELLVVVVIIGVLVAIAVPVYMNYRKGAENKSAESDVRGAISAVEQFYTENGNQYPANNTVGAKGANVSFAALTGGQAETATVSSGNILEFQNNTSSYVICAQSTDGGGIYVYNSATGGSVQKSKEADVATCLSKGD